MRFYYTAACGLMLGFMQVMVSYSIFRYLAVVFTFVCQMQYCVPSCILVVPPYTMERNWIFFHHYSFIVTCCMLVVCLYWGAVCSSHSMAAWVLELLMAATCSYYIWCWTNAILSLVKMGTKWVFLRRNSSGLCCCGVRCKKLILQLSMPRLACTHLCSSPTCSNSAIKSTGMAGKCFTS